MMDTGMLLDGWATALWRASWQGGLAALAVWFVGWLAERTASSVESGDRRR